MQGFSKSLFFLLLLTLSSVSSFAATITAKYVDGNWANHSTWDLNRVPESGDLVIIPEGKTVTVNSNLYNEVV